VPAGTEGVKVGTVIATLVGEDEDAESGAHPRPLPPAGREPQSRPSPLAAAGAAGGGPEPKPEPKPASAPVQSKGDRVIASPLAKRLAADKGVDLAALSGSGPRGRIVRADVEAAKAGTAAPRPATSSSVPAAAPVPAPAPPAPIAMADETRALLDERVPHTVEKLSGMRKTIARRLAQSMQQAPHIYLTVDVRLDRLLAMRTELNASLEKRGIKLSVNDLLIKALGKALVDVPACNVTFAGNELIRYSRADVSVAVSIPGGLITPIVQDADGRSLSSIAEAMKDLGARAKDGKLQPGEYQGGTASLSNMGMMGIKHFTAVINPPQSTILAIGAGEKRPWVMEDGTLGVATVMTATGSFDHRAVDGADGARLMAAFKGYVERPLGMVA
jgi:pyruvate dehydrogenase E2 component (dihydrolipoamide acetyltransferase)